MKYLLRPLDPDYPDLWFDTNNINDLVRLSGSDEDVVYVAGTAYHAPLNEKRPSTRITNEYVRELEADLLAAKVLIERGVFLVATLITVEMTEDMQRMLPVVVNKFLQDGNKFLCAAKEATA